jgi:hypothetical protein
MEHQSMENAVDSNELPSKGRQEINKSTIDTSSGNKSRNNSERKPDKDSCFED